MAVILRRTRVYLASTWPGPTNTGVPAGTSLTPFSGNFSTSSNGQVVQDLDIAGSIIVQHQNVTFRRCRVIMPLAEITPLFFANVNLGSFTIEDCELDGQNKAGSSGIFYDSGAVVTVVARRLNIKRVENGAGVLSNFDMRDSWIHALDPGGADPHTDGLQTSAGVSNVTLIHNFFDMDGPDNGANNSCIQFNTTSTDNADWLIQNNRLRLHPVTGGACIRIPNGNASANNLRVLGNRLMPGTFGYRIPSDAATNHITEWSGNVNDDTGVSVP